MLDRNFNSELNLTRKLAQTEVSILSRNLENWPLEAIMWPERHHEFRTCELREVLLAVGRLPKPGGDG